MTQNPARCPTCNTEIRVLLYRYEAEIAEEFLVTEAGEPEYKDMEISPRREIQGVHAYYCPECDALVTTDPDKALELLTRDTPKEATL